MPALPWITVEPATTDQPVVMASRFEVRSLLAVPGFFITSMALWRQARRSNGAIGLALKADLLKRTFWTVSAWNDRQAINDYARSEPHRSAMKSKRKVMKESTFTFWSASEFPISWDEVERRIAAERAGRTS
ncbi:MAG: DUF3291 domain-containing protein [Nonomuraea sp.]|nr:DUF3291 domain-containing protein [Nonomuraea sp.]